MPVIVSFMKPGTLGAVSAIGIGVCRKSETVTVPGTTTASAEDGEIAVVLNTETAAVMAAHGKTPNASATDSTAATSARWPLTDGYTTAVAVKAGDKLAFAAVG